MAKDAKKQATSCTPTTIGGQAVLEGVMMRGKRSWAVAARDPEGVIQVEQYPLKSAAAKNAWMRWPVVRGVVALVESLALGTRSLTISARLAGLGDIPEDGEAEEKAGECVQTSDEASATADADAPESEPEEKKESALTGGMIAGSVILGVVFAMGIFILLPAFVTDALMGFMGSADAAGRSHLGWNALDGVVRIVIFFGYVALIGLMPDIRRVFRYHGAEHKVISALEHGDPLTVEAARPYPTLHARCGTAFLIMVMALAILVFSLVPVNLIYESLHITNRFAILGVRIVVRLLLLPLVAGLAYEVTVKWAAPRAEKWYVKPLLWPGLQMQRLTTGEPDDSMLEVAIAATNRVLAGDEEGDEPGEEPVLPAEFDLLDDAL